MIVDTKERKCTVTKGSMVTSKTNMDVRLEEYILFETVEYPSRWEYQIWMLS
jgi:hypothetical protein